MRSTLFRRLILLFRAASGEPAPAPSDDKLLLEGGDYLLLESGDKLLLE